MRIKKILKLLIGSNNQGKIKEIRDLLPKNLDIFFPKDLHLMSPKENGKSFEKNSLIKAKYFSKQSKIICRVCRNSGWVQEIADVIRLFNLHIGWEKSVPCLYCEGQPNYEVRQITDSQETLQ